MYVGVFFSFILFERQFRGSGDDVLPLRRGIKAKVELRSLDTCWLRLLGVCGFF